VHDIDNPGLGERNVVTIEMSQDRYQKEFSSMTRIVLRLATIFASVALGMTLVGYAQPTDSGPAANATTMTLADPGCC
jgi:hypothetical protein